MRKRTCSLILDMTASLYYLVLFSCLSLCATRSLSLIPTESTLLADKEFVLLWVRRGPILEKLCCVLSSCLANAQLYMSDTIEHRRGLNGEAEQQTSFLVLHSVIYCGFVDSVLRYHFFLRGSTCVKPAL